MFRLQSSVATGVKCGQLIGFEASDRHGIIPSESQRCALVTRYTPDQKFDNPVQRNAMSYLNQLDEKKPNKTAADHIEVIRKFEKEGTTVVMAGEDLKGKERVVADGIVDEASCQALMELAKNGVVGDGYKSKNPLSIKETFLGLNIAMAAESGAILGDGYEDKGNEVTVNISPHTDYEVFEGLTIRRAVKLAKGHHVAREAVELYLNASERSRLFVEKFFNLTHPLYFDYTHLVCRTAIEGEQDGRDDLSHPVHADNCMLKPDGSCIRSFPAYVQRDYSAIMYLNDDFEGGEFFFAHHNLSAHVTLKPKCGRIVGFNAADLHGVRGVVKGQRCAVAMWYTMDPNYKELARIQAHKVLAKLPDTPDSNKENVKHEEL